MVIKNYRPRKHDFISREIKTGFAFFPTHDFITGEYFWFERYYYYDDTRFIYKSRRALYRDKKEFYHTLKT